MTESQMLRALLQACSKQCLIGSGSGSGSAAGSDSPLRSYVIPGLPDPASHSARGRLTGIPRQALIELYARGLLTCTSGKPGEDGATYALAWLPLDDPERYSAEVRERHAENMLRFSARRTTHERRPTLR